VVRICAANQPDGSQFISDNLSVELRSSPHRESRIYLAGGARRIVLRGGAIAFLELAFLLPVTARAASSYEWTLVTDSAAYTPRDGAGAAVLNGQMWLLGGWNPDAFPPYSTTNEVWKSTDGADWTFVDYAPWEGRHTFGNVIFGNKMWILGGDPLRAHYQPDVWYSTDGVNWMQATARAPWGLRCLQYAVLHDGKIWVMGGETMTRFVPDGPPDAHYNDVWCSSNGVNWTQVTAHAAWSPRGMIGGSVALNGRMWLLGGGTYSPRSHFNDIWSSADGVNWRRDLAAAPWAPRQYHDIAVFDNKMWVLEGYNGDLGGNRNDVWYSADGVNWTELPDTPWAPRHAASVFVFDNALWMVGGNNMEKDVWRLDVVPDEPPDHGACCYWGSGPRCLSASEDECVGSYRGVFMGVDTDCDDADGDGTADICAGALGDLNCDGLVDLDDIGPFVSALIDPPGYAIAYPLCDIHRADTNKDAQENGLDIQSFVNLLLIREQTKRISAFPIPEDTKQVLPVVGLADRVPSGRRLPPEHLAAARWFLAKFPEELAGIHQALQLERGCGEVTPTENPAFVLQPALSDARLAAKVLAVELLVAAEDGDSDQARKIMLDMCRIFHACHPPQWLD
jgi:hypothetical protein